MLESIRAVRSKLKLRFANDARAIVEDRHRGDRRFNNGWRRRSSRRSRTSGCREKNGEHVVLFGNGTAKAGLNFRTWARAGAAVPP